MSNQVAQIQSDMPVVDPTLSISGAAAESKQTGVAIHSYGITDVQVNLLDDDAAGAGVGTIAYDDGTINSVAGFYHSDYIMIKNLTNKLSFAKYNAANIRQIKGTYHRLAFYDRDKVYVSGIDNNAHDTDMAYSTVNVPNDAVYVRVGFRGDKATYARSAVCGDTYLYPFKAYTGDIITSGLQIDSLKNSLSAYQTEVNGRLGAFSNLYNKYAVGNGSGFINYSDGEVVANAGFVHTDYIYVYNIPKITCFSAVGRVLQRSYHRLAFYDQNLDYVSGIDNNAGQTNLANAVVTVPIGAYYVRISYTVISDMDIYVNPDEKYLELDAYQVDLWNNKIWSAYGDSITAISNGDGLNLGWAKYVNGIHLFSQFYGRGIGAQKFAWGTAGGSVCFIEADGNLNSRNDAYNKDNYTGAVPAGCVSTRGAFCSWDRITHMYPAAIKDDIDMIFVMGGTNDTHDATDPVFNVGDTTDPEWAASAYYATYGGDYNISTIRGGIASTLMKLQAWMPNAMIIIGTPLSGRTVTDYQLGAGEYDKAGDVKTVAEMASIPLIDVYGTCGINPWNSTTYISDGIHPYYEAGKQMLGQTVAEGLNKYIPRF